ncbi:TetR/AcrR family transcriptional regulator [Corynebacterium lubricantis]|uniref:TetR/AcrR family transcriptional regulator n=1 Tax=Corynebacterium lubricantis TaxID=541095 RepID=UPI00035C3EB3|nr:TetR/AcrR family transcriptional regulator [Corynebacterium lubricantis]
MAGAVGRPRKSGPRRKGKTARDEILDAASELFTTQGFSTTSTHQIAEAVGIRQASLYYHFPSKTEIFLTLLKETVDPALAMAEDFAESDATPAMKLWALVASQSRSLLISNWNIGRLYQLPIATSEEFAEYHESRQALEEIFQSLAAELVGPDDPRTVLPFHMALIAVEMRDNTGTAPFSKNNPELPPYSIMLADAVLEALEAQVPDDHIEQTKELIQKVDATAAAK